MNFQTKNVSVWEITFQDELPQIVIARTVQDALQGSRKHTYEILGIRWIADSITTVSE